MTLHARPYRDPADLAAMRRLLMDGQRANPAGSYMHPGLLDWAIHYPPDERAFQRDLRLWEQADGQAPALAAWAFCYEHEGSFDVFVHPAHYGTDAHEAVMDEYVAWAEARAREAGLKHIWPWWAMADDAVLDRLMRARGYVVDPAEPAAPLFGRALEALPEAPLPAGFTLQTVRTLADGEQRARVTHAAFRPRFDWARAWDEFMGYMRSDVYDGERDLLVLAPDGRGAAMCTIWFDPVNAVGLFEPVATHPDFQRRGLGRAVMAEGLRRMRAAGMTRAVLGFDPRNAPARALYTSLGFAAVRYFSTARKQL